MQAILKNEIACAVVRENCNKTVSFVCHHCGRPICDEQEEISTDTEPENDRNLGSWVVGGAMVLVALFFGFQLQVPELLGLGLLILIDTWVRRHPASKRRLVLSGGLLLLLSLRALNVLFAEALAPDTLELVRWSGLITGSVLLVAGIALSVVQRATADEQACGFILGDPEFPALGHVLMGHIVGNDDEDAQRAEKEGRIARAVPTIAKGFKYVVVAIYVAFFVYTDALETEMGTGGADVLSTIQGFAMALLGVSVLALVGRAYVSLRAADTQTDPRAFGASPAVHCASCVHDI